MNLSVVVRHVTNKKRVEEPRQEILKTVRKLMMYFLTKKPKPRNQALEALQADRDFLTQDGVFSDDLIAAFIALKHKEVTILETTPHPAEFNMYDTL